MITEYTQICIFCRKPKQDVHHCLFGVANRKLSDADELVLPVCREHHELLHKNDKISRVIGQLAYERDRCAEGDTMEEARMKFISRYGKNYL